MPRCASDAVWTGFYVSDTYHTYMFCWFLCLFVCAVAAAAAVQRRCLRPRGALACRSRGYMRLLYLFVCVCACSRTRQRTRLRSSWRSFVGAWRACAGGAALTPGPCARGDGDRSRAFSPVRRTLAFYFPQPSAVQGAPARAPAPARGRRGVGHGRRAHCAHPLSTSRVMHGPCRVICVSISRNPQTCATSWTTSTR